MTRPKAEAVAREIAQAMSGCATVEFTIEQVSEILTHALDAAEEAGRETEREEWMTVGCTQHAAEARKAGKIEGLKEARAQCGECTTGVHAWQAIHRLIAAQEAKEEGD